MLFDPVLFDSVLVDSVLFDSVLFDLVALAPADNTRARCAARPPPVFLSGRGGYLLQ
ncbi:hypothetical protein [Nocardioides sp.]|uniref:hypothetical protein n=1 Tax=Nocardioides sp. TaxID=35761 RepID=UPI0031FEF1F8